MYTKKLKIRFFQAPHTRLGNRGYIKPVVTGATSALVFAALLFIIMFRSDMTSWQVKKSKCLSECL